MAARSRRADRLSQDLRNATPASEYMSSVPTAPQLQARTDATAPQSRTASASQAAPAVSSSTTSDQPPSLSLAPSGPINFGLRDDMMAELAELVDDPNEETRRRIEAAKKAREEAEAAQRQAQEAVPSNLPTTSTFVHQTAHSSPRPSQSGPASASQTPPVTAAATPPGSPGSRRPNPNNPFRSRLANSGSASPTFPNQGSRTVTPSHSRTASSSELGLAFGTGAVGAAPATIPFAVPEAAPSNPAAAPQQIEFQQHPYPREAQQ